MITLESILDCYGRLTGKRKITVNIDKIPPESVRSSHDNFFLNVEIKDLLDLIPQHESDETLLDVLASYLTV